MDDQVASMCFRRHHAAVHTTATRTRVAATAPASVFTCVSGVGGARAALSCSPLPPTIPSGTCRLRRLRKFRGHRGSVKALSSIDAATLASGGRDGNSLCGTTGYRSHAQHVQLRRVDSRRPQPHAVSHGRRLFCVRRHPPRVEPRRVVKVVDAS